jgi:alkylation response protein AidB-like acyl-CoA dehydrogenase
MDFEVPEATRQVLRDLDSFIAKEITPLQERDDNMRFFDHRREFSRTDWTAGGLPAAEWEALLDQARLLADRAGWWRWALPRQYRGHAATNLEMALIREHLASQGLGLHCDLQNEFCVVGNHPALLMIHQHGSDEQRQEFVEAIADGERGVAFGLTEPSHGSDATYLETIATLQGDTWVINGRKRWNTGVHTATHDIIFARSSGQPGEHLGITAFLVPMDAAGLEVGPYLWTFNMPTDHAEVNLRDVRVPSSAVLGEVGRGLDVAQAFVHENRIRQAASSLGAAQYCINEAVAYANDRIVFGRKLSTNQAIQFPLAELHTEAALVRQLIRYSAWQLDRQGHMEVSDLVAMCNYRANRLACDAADRAMQTCGGMGYSRHMPFEHIYRHHRRYRITEGSEEIQIRRVAQRLFGFDRGKQSSTTTTVGNV